MNVLIVFAHNEPQSFNAAMKTLAVEEFEAQAMLAMTIGGQPHMLTDGGIHGELDDMLRPILRGTLAYTGMTVLPPFVAHHVPYIKPAQRAELLEQYRQRLRQIDSLVPLQCPSMDDFDDMLHPLKRADADQTVAAR
ncbi:Flavodoxin-like fold protein [compost metagenome]